uniref:Si:ch73-127m5.2 n=1 Tax=Tetraodon nigroviridis TaxID=99883 RepID=H3DAD3_TETNG
MDASTGVMSLDAQGNMVFTVVKPVMGIFQVSSDQMVNAPLGGMGLQGLSENTVTVPQTQSQPQVDQNQVGGHPTQTHSQPQGQITLPGQTENMAQDQDLPPGLESTTPMPFAEVSSLLDPNMKGSKARKHLVSYDEIKRRLQAPEKMSLRSLAAYTRVSRGPASKKTLLGSLSLLGLKPSTTTSVSSSFSKLTEGDTRALCDDMRDFAHDYIDYGHMAKQLIPEINTVQHWSKIIETKNHLEDMRKCFRDPLNSSSFDNVTHGLGLGMLDAALDVIVTVIEQQIRILSGAAVSDRADSAPSTRRVRRRQRKASPTEGERSRRGTAGVGGRAEGVSRPKARSKPRKRTQQEGAAGGPGEPHTDHDQLASVDGNILTLVSLGYESVSGSL